MSEATSDISANPPSSQPAGEGADPFESLFKMSATAGAGTAEYVAINGTSIAAILLGIASALVLFGSPLLLLLPAAGIVCAALAIRQIRNSNGTQTGISLAIIGLLFSLGLGGYFITTESLAAARNHSDEQQVIEVIRKFGDFIHNEKYADAYALCDSTLTNRVPEAVFAEKWKATSASPLLGKVKSMDWNQLLHFDIDPVTGDRTCSGMILLGFEKITGQDRLGMAFRKVNDHWLVDDVPSQFPPDAPGNGGRGSRSSGGPTGPAGPPAPR